MAPPESHSTAPTLPEVGVSYPFKIGKSLRNPRTSRDFLALKYMHIPDKVSLSEPATLRREQDTCQVQMPTTDGDSSVVFEGPCRSPNPRRESTFGDYMLIFVNGEVWLERAGDYFQNMRATDGARNEGPRMEYPEGGGLEEEDEVARDGDSWMGGGADDDEEGGSPITPEEDGVMVGEEGNGGRFGGKGVGGMAGVGGNAGLGRMVSAGRVGLKSVAGKSVAGKGPSNVSGASGRRRGRDDEEDEDDGGSTSDDDEDDSDDSESDSDSDGSFTEESSEEE